MCRLLLKTALCWSLTDLPSPPSAFRELENHPCLFCLSLGTADEPLQCQPYYCFYFSGYAFQSPMQNKEAELLLHSKKLHILFSITVQSPLWWRLGFKIFFFSGCTSPVFYLHRSLDERNLSWHLMLVYSLPDHLLLHFLSSYHRWQALPPHSAIELWGILASFSCLSKVIWKYMLTKSKNTHRRNSNR